MATKSTRATKKTGSKRKPKSSAATNSGRTVIAPTGVTARPGSVRALIISKCSDQPVPVTELLDAAAEMGKSKVTVYRQLRECGFEVETGSRLVVRAK